jgi:acetyl esterase/lipase
MKAVATFCLTIAIVAFVSSASPASEGKIHKGIYYGPKDATEYQKEKCQLDIYLPSDESKNFPVLIFFHGGGLTGGSRGGPNLTSEGICLVAPSYRLGPEAKCPDYINDAADAVAWTFKNIEKYGGDPNRIFVSGGSAGSYLASIITMDKSWLETRGVDIDMIAGLIPVSGHMITHFTVRKERGISASCGLSDKYAPLFHVRKTPFPIFIQCGDNDYPGRQEENKLFVSMMIKYAEQAESEIIYKEYPGTHGTFGKDKRKQEDFARFILEQSGMVGPSKPLDDKQEID